MRQRLLFLVTAVLVGSATTAAQAQSAFGFEFRAVAKVVQGTDTLRNAWAGGLNSPQFSTIDLNGDQQPDLYVFDRAQNRSFTFLSVATDNGRVWQHEPIYEGLFPTGLQGWVLLRDYDCDNRPDLFTYASGGDIRIYHNVAGANGLPSFQLVTNQLTYFDPSPTTGGDINIITGGYNIPAIQDIDGDGRLDVLTFDFASTAPSIYYYRNTSTGACGGLQFREGSKFWGGITACLSGCTSFTFAPDQCRPVLRPNHTGGYNLTALDLDGDGDQDLLSGRDNCPELVSLRNDGTAQEARMTSAGLNQSFPTGTTAARVPNFPAAYSVDVTFDGRPDIVVSPNLYDNVDTVETRQSVVVYRNTSATGAPVLAYQQNNFLQAGMIDLSEGAAPTFGDLDGDGLVDMLVGSVSRNNPKQHYQAALSYYRNVGTARKPIFSLVTNDYLGLTSRRLVSLKPVLVDLNRDGALDLVYSGYQQGATANPITYVLNTATARQPAAFNLASAGTLAGMPGRAFDAPCFADVDADGLVDLLLGTNSVDTPGQSLRYYRNTGANNISQAFVLINNDYGQLRNNANRRPVALHPTVADFDGDGQPDLLTADALGEIRMYSNFRSQPSSFLARTDLFYNALLGQYQENRLGTAAVFRYAPATADVDGDGVPELFLGLEGGGIVALATRRQVLSTNSAATTLPLQVYPNPTTGRATVEAPRPVRVTILDITGRTVRQDDALNRTHTLSLTGLAPGIYLVRCQTATGEQAMQRLEVQ